MLDSRISITMSAKSDNSQSLRDDVRQCNVRQCNVLALEICTGSHIHDQAIIPQESVENCSRFLEVASSEVALM